MLTKRIIPCLDVTAGRVVKGVNFVSLTDVGDPVEIAKAYNEAGADELVFLDITATVELRQTMIDVVERTAEQVFIPLTVGGGISSVSDMKELLQAGADKISLNSAAIKRPELIQEGARNSETNVSLSQLMPNGMAQTGASSLEAVEMIPDLMLLNGPKKQSNSVLVKFY